MCDNYATGTTGHTPPKDVETRNGRLLTPRMHGHIEGAEVLDSYCAKGKRHKYAYCWSKKRLSYTSGCVAVCERASLSRVKTWKYPACSGDNFLACNGDTGSANAARMSRSVQSECHSAIWKLTASPDPAYRHKRQACHARATSMPHLPDTCAAYVRKRTPATQSAAAQTSDQARHQIQHNAASATPATQQPHRRHQAPLLPYKPDVDITECHACYTHVTNLCV